MEQWTTGEVAKQCKVSVRTLRYYDQIQLLIPSYKDDNGKRYYSEDDLFELQKIQTLKSAGLPLDDIRNVLENFTYKQLLISHYNFLQEKLSELQTSIAHTTSLIHMIDLDETLSWEHVAKLIEQSEQTDSKKWVDYFNEDEKQILQETMPNVNKNEESTQKYMLLLHRIEHCIAQKLPPECEEAEQIAAELIELSEMHFANRPDLMEKFWEVRKLPTNETGLFPISKEALEFAEQAIIHFENK